MKQLTHSQTIPRVLQNKPTLVNPRKAWENFKGTGQVREALLPAQKYLCSYCEIELADIPLGLGSHIEHIESKTLNPHLTFVFTNLMLSCFQTGGELKGTEEDTGSVSCGHAPLKRKNRYNAALFIKPTETDCERYFFYELDGRIVPHPELDDTERRRAEHTIEVLNLNCRRLTRQRAEMIREGLEIVADLSDAPEALAHFIDAEISEVATNKMRAFHTTRLQYFQDLA